MSIDLGFCSEDMKNLSKSKGIELPLMLHDGEAGLSFRVGLRKNCIHYTQCKFLFDAAK